MPGFELMGKQLIIFGAILIGLGLLIIFVKRLPRFGKLPADISFKRGKTTFHFPLIISLVLSLLLTLILNLVLYLFNR